MKSFFPVVDKFCYLETFLTRSCTDNEDVCNIIRRAGNAFGALRKMLFSNSSITYAANGATYRSLIIPILLYGSDSWCLTETLYSSQLRSFHHYYLRAMCRVNRLHTFLHNISSEDVMGWIQLKP